MFGLLYGRGSFGKSKGREIIITFMLNWLRLFKFIAVIPDTIEK